MAVTDSLSDSVGKKAACFALGIPISSFYRHQSRLRFPAKRSSRPVPPLALSDHEKQTILDTAHEKRFRDATPYQIYATLLDEGRYLASVRTIYRVLAENN